MKIKDKVAIVTGGASGIGKEIVRELLKKEAKHIAILDINEYVGEQTVDELAKCFDKKTFQFIRTDVTNNNSFEDAFKKIIDEFGNVDIVINNAGICDEIKYETMIDINFTSVVRGTHLGFKYLSKENGHKGGIILNTASYAGILNLYPTPVYSATKSGIIHLVECFGVPFHENDTGVKVMALCPGYTPNTCLFNRPNSVTQKTIDGIKEFVKKEENQKPESVARGAVFAIEEGKSGSIWIVDGGKLYIVDKPKIEMYKKKIVKSL